MNKDEQKGYDFTFGCLRALVIPCWIVIGLYLIVLLLRGGMGIGLNNSDKGGWQRSGLKVHIDYKTGIQYLSTKKGGIIRRATK